MAVSLGLIVQPRLALRVIADPAVRVTFSLLPAPGLVVIGTLMATFAYLVASRRASVSQDGSGAGMVSQDGSGAACNP